MSPLPLQLHVWPGRWGLPSIDASCIEAILYLQLNFSDHYSIVETADPDLSPSGQLPFLTHNQVTVSSAPSIISYLSNLNLSILSPTDPEDIYETTTEISTASLDAGLSSVNFSKAVAWRAYIETQLGDLLAHSFFVLDPNYRAFTHGLLASMLSVPQRYYVPNRIKETYRPRLQAVGLWQIANEPEEPENGERNQLPTTTSEDKERKIRRAFGQAKLVEKAQPVFETLSRLLDGKSFVFDDRPRVVDLALASRILLLLKAPLPNSALKDILESSYPTLVAHASHTHALAFQSSAGSLPPILSPPRMNPLSGLKSALVRLSRAATTKAVESEEETRFRRYRWGWIALSTVGALGFLVANGFIRIEHIEHEASELESEEINEDDSPRVDI